MQDAQCGAMSATSSRSKAIRINLALSLIAGAAWAWPAHADVMEITASGATWIAGGPAVRSSEARQAAAMGDPVVTEATATAGPRNWQARIAELSVKYDVSPALLDAVVWQESRWNVDAVSPAGARGLAQLMPATARMMGVDPDDPHANLEGGARYLRMQLDRFGGDLEKALAAYNAGPARVVKAGGVPAIRETRDYVAAILARLSAPVRR
jgi:soluble lytic murein transglycosylase-like protein